MPGGLDEQLPNLHSLLKLVSAQGQNIDTLINWPGPDDQTTLRDALRRMGRSGLVEKTGRASCRVTEDGDAWLENPTPASAIAIFHRNVKFLGEFLHILASAPKQLTHEDAKELANRDYRLAWNSLDPFRGRTTWFRACGLVELQFDSTLKITSTGRDLLSELSVVTPQQIAEIYDDAAEVDEPLPGPDPILAAELSQANGGALAGRKAQIGYIPRSKNIDIVESIRFLVGLATPSISRQEFGTRCAEKYKIKDSSASAALSMLIGAGLVQQTGATTYESTELAASWYQSGSDLDLVRIIHLNILFVGELLHVLETPDRAPALAALAVTYGMPRQDSNGVRTRLHLLLSSGLVQEITWGKYRVTQLGRRFRETIPCQEAADSAEFDNQPETADHTVSRSRDHAEQLAAEITAAAADADSPERFELAVRDAFRYLGFSADHVGGPGRTDVLVQYPGPTGRSITVIVDAKATGASSVDEKLINFDTIAEHQQHHEADHACLVGRAFNQSRLPARATRRRVTLLDASLLADAVLKQRRSALQVTEIARIFENGTDPASILERAWKESEQRNMLFTHVVAALAREAVEADDVTEGTLSVDNLYFLLRSDLPVRPKPSEIEAVIELLSSPLINAVGESDKKQYRAEERPAFIAARLRALAVAAESVDEID